jgi:hypothetical protein
LPSEQTVSSIPAQNVEVIHTSAIEFAQEFNKDKDAASKKYSEVDIELSGTVSGLTRSVDDTISIFLNSSDGLGILCRTADDDLLGNILPGQSVVVRGRLAVSQMGPALTKCTIVKKGPTTGFEFTANEFVQAWAGDSAAADQKFGSQSIVVTGIVKSITPNSVGAVTVLLAAANDMQVDCRFTSLDGFDTQSMKVGELTRIVGTFSRISSGDKGPSIGFCKRAAEAKN